jgi:hypothetical protein
MCCVPCFTGGSYSGNSSADETWVDDGGRSQSIAASYLSDPTSPTSFTMGVQSPTDTDANSHTSPASFFDGYLPGPGGDLFSGGITANCPDWDDIERIPWLDLLGGAVRAPEAGQVSARTSCQRHVIHHVWDPRFLSCMTPCDAASLTHWTLERGAAVRALSVRGLRGGGAAGPDG